MAIANIVPAVPAFAIIPISFQNNSIEGESLYSCATLIISSLFGLSESRKISIRLSI